MRITTSPRFSIIAGVITLATLPFVSRNDYYLHVATLIGVYWILIAGLNLVVGFTGQLSIGHVGLLAIGAYAYSILAGSYGLEPLIALGVAGVIGAVCGLLLGLPSLRLPDFYFAMATMAFALIVAELALGFGDLTGGGTGLPSPPMPPPFASTSGLYWLVLLIAGVLTLMTSNVARSMWGRSLIAVRDSTIAAASVGINVYRAKITVFVFSGFTAGLAGALFGSLQSYISPDTFPLDIGLFFFTAIIVGGRGSIVGPFLGTAMLTLLPEAVSALANLGAFFYGLLLLLVVLLIPEGVGRAVSRLLVKKAPLDVHHIIKPDLSALTRALAKQRV